MKRNQNTHNKTIKQWKLNCKDRINHKKINPYNNNARNKIKSFLRSKFDSYLVEKILNNT